MQAPPVGARIQVLRSSATRGDFFEGGAIVRQLTDAGPALLLEIELDSGRRIQRFWPHPTIQRSLR